ncbi:MAG: hypothetical protein KGP29_07245 [Proteobacteria bacterium]|nr:hypothetical protein [Pseudomonadota bacterium]
MKQEEKNLALTNINSLKREIMIMRIKSSSGEAFSIKDYKSKKKEVAKLFTKLNTPS